MIAHLVTGLGLLAGLTERGRTIAHLVLALGLLAALAAAGLVYFIRRRRRDQTREEERTPE